VRIPLRDRWRYKIVARGRVEYVPAGHGRTVPTLHPTPRLRQGDELRLGRRLADRRDKRAGQGEYVVLRRRF
jgi:hypothetical protein